MNSPSATRTKKGPQRVEEGASSQRGAVSPFMFGLLVGMTIFSAMSLQWAKQELEAQQKRQFERARTQAEDIAKGVEFTILTETENTYSEDVDLKKALANSSLATGKTRGGQDVLMVARNEEQGTLGENGQRIAITGSDDTLARAKVFQTGTASQLARLKNTGNMALAVVDTASVRERQVMSSNKSMEALAEYVYAFYAGHMGFPSGSDFEALNQKVGLLDVWGRPFTYTRVDNDHATLEFTTPWNYTQTLNLSLKDEIASPSSTTPE